MRVIRHFESEEEYMELFHNKIDKADTKSIAFSKKSIAYHNSFYDWKNKPVMCITDSGGKDIGCVLFYNVTQDGYCSIINIVSPNAYRRQGLARELLGACCAYYCNDSTKRLRMNCDPSAKPFYDKLGFLYWGLTKSGDYYCNVPFFDDIEKYKDLSSMSVRQLLSGIPEERVLRLIDRRVFEGSGDTMFDELSQYVKNKNNSLFGG